MEDNKTYAPIRLEGGALYKSIKSISFTPVMELEKMKVAVPKGKIYFWKLWGLIPLIPLRANEDLYESKNLICRYANLKLAAETKYRYSHYFLKGETVYQMAEVDVYCSDWNNNMHKRFTTNSEAMKFFEDIKEKCKKHNNYLN